MNTEEAIALTLNEAWEMREASYEKANESDFSGEYKRSMEDCLIEACKGNGLSVNMWALLSLAMHWLSGCRC